MNSMSHPYRAQLPQLQNTPFLTDGGLETYLTYQENWELPEFAAFVLLENTSGVASLEGYYRNYIDIALTHEVGFILESPTWRASPAWGNLLGFNEAAIVDINKKAITLLEGLRDNYATKATPIVISGCVGPQSDGYAPTEQLSALEAQDYHTTQIRAFAETAADMVCAVTMTYAEEAIGISHAAQAAGLPVAISFTVETDGSLPAGQPLAEAIAQVDQATDAYPAYYMVNCAHPSHFLGQLSDGGAWVERIAGVRANASRKSHEELDASSTLDDGDPIELGEQYGWLQKMLPKLNVMGGCCGTDHRHVAAIAARCINPLVEA